MLRGLLLNSISHVDGCNSVSVMTTFLQYTIVGIFSVFFPSMHFSSNFWAFIYLKRRVRERYHWLVHSQNGHTNKVMVQTRDRSFIRVSLMSGGAQARGPSSTSFPGAGSRIRSDAAGTRNDSFMGCQLRSQQLALYHSASPKVNSFSFLSFWDIFRFARKLSTEFRNNSVTFMKKRICLGKVWLCTYIRLSHMKKSLTEISGRGWKGSNPLRKLKKEGIWLRR